MTEQIGTLEELGVKPGDVVDQLDGMSHDGQRNYFVCNGPDPYGNPGPWLCRSKDGDTSKGWSSSKKNCRIVSRATPEPSIDLTAIREPFGLLDKATQDALVAHGGPYQYFGIAGVWVETGRCGDWPGVAVRAKPGPKRETVTKEAYVFPDGVVLIDHSKGNCTITYDTIDGEIDVATYKVTKK